jgi:hypothetical protein
VGECIIETWIQMSDNQKNEVIEVLFDIPTNEEQPTQQLV